MSLLFEPFREGHALVETMFYINFAPALDEAALGVLSNPIPELSEMLPKHQALKTIQLKVDQVRGQSVSEAPSGAEYAKLREDGIEEWKLRVNAESLSIHCLDYTRWDEVWPFAKKVMLILLARISSGTSISAIGLKNIDRFDFIGNEDQYDLEDLLNLRSDFLPNNVVNKGPLWHCNMGWFENIEPNSGLHGNEVRVLNQINVAGSRERNPSGGRYFVSVDQNLMLRSEAEDQLVIANNDHQYIDKIYRAFHDLNKDSLGELLSEAMTKRINLRPSSK